MKMRHLFRRNDPASRSLLSTAAVASLLAPLAAIAQAPGDIDQTRGELCGFLGNITTLLNMGSIAVVTIAIIFAGYQIAFAHKRISDVAPILIGGLLIGAATQIARMVIGTEGGECPAVGAMLLDALLPHYA